MHFSRSDKIKEEKHNLMLDDLSNTYESTPQSLVRAHYVFIKVFSLYLDLQTSRQEVGK